MVITEHYKEGAPVGPVFQRLIKQSHVTMMEKNDDFVFVIAGTTGSGKSSLGLWTYETIDPEGSIEQVGLTRSDFAKLLHRASTLPRPKRYAQNDEGKLNRREWNNDWSREVLEIYHDIRGLNIWHTWCTAMPNLLDREFVKERVKGFAFVYTKGTTSRRFLYFTRDDLLKFMDRNDGKLSMDLLKKYGRTFASLDSYFTAYKGPLWDEYEEKKEERMTERVTEFYKKWGMEGKSARQLGGELGVSKNTVISKTAKLVKEGLMASGEDFSVSPTGQYQFTPSGEDKLKLYGFSENLSKSVLAPLADMPVLSSSYNARKAKRLTLPGGDE